MTRPMQWWDANSSTFCQPANILGGRRWKRSSKSQSGARQLKRSVKYKWLNGPRKTTSERSILGNYCASKRRTCVNGPSLYLTSSNQQTIGQSISELTQHHTDLLHPPQHNQCLTRTTTSYRITHGDIRRLSTHDRLHACQLNARKQIKMHTLV